MKAKRAFSPKPTAAIDWLNTFVWSAIALLSVSFSYLLVTLTLL